MKKQHLLPLLLLPLLVTGCGQEHISERLYTQTIGLTGESNLTLHAQAFGKDTPFSAAGITAAEAMRNCEAAQGGQIFIGHTELLCLDGSRTLTDVQELLLTQGLSPACKLLHTDVGTFFEDPAGTELLETIRMAECSGLMAETDISTVLDEWLGNSQTALIPTLSNGALGMAFLHTDGTSAVLSREAACGMYWLRRNAGKDFTMTVETPDGALDISILRSTLQKSAGTENGRTVLRYALTVYTDDCPKEARHLLQEAILSQCSAAISEMDAADADVIGMQSLLEFADTDAAEYSVITEISVR